MTAKLTGCCVFILCIAFWQASSKGDALASSPSALVIYLRRIESRL